jgi:hypothetical protein
VPPQNRTVICTLCGADDPLATSHGFAFGRVLQHVVGGTTTYGDFEDFSAVACRDCVAAERERRRPTVRMVLVGAAACLLTGVLVVSLAPELKADLRNAVMIGCGLCIIPIVIAAKWGSPGADAVALDAACRQAGAKGLTVFYTQEAFLQEKNRGGLAFRAPGVVPEKYLKPAAAGAQPPLGSPSRRVEERFVPCPNCAYPVPRDTANCPSCGTGV